MANNFVRNNQSPILPLALVILGIAAGLFYYTQLFQGTQVPIPPPQVAADDNLSKFRDFNFDFSIFDDQRFKSLKIFGESPINPGSTGRTDVFAPY